MDESGDLTQIRGRFDERMDGLARRRINRRDTHLVAGVPHALRCRLGVATMKVSQEDVLADTDPPGDRLADLAGPDDDDDVPHDESSLGGSPLWETNPKVFRF